MKKMNTTTEELFNEWYERFGCRYYSANHGNADGHRDYLHMAFVSGLNAAQTEEPINDFFED
jgi:hypothetical protein